MAARFLAKVQSSRARQRLPLRGSCHGAAVTEGVCVPVPPQALRATRSPFCRYATFSPGAGEICPQGVKALALGQAPKIDFSALRRKTIDGASIQCYTDHKAALCAAMDCYKGGNGCVFRYSLFSEHTNARARRKRDHTMRHSISRRQFLKGSGAAALSAAAAGLLSSCGGSSASNGGGTGASGSSST